MTHDVFISHSSKDKSIADAVCTSLEKAKIRCWIAPRDIRPGEKWAGAITNAIENGKIMVLIFSSNSNNSDDVLNEIMLAKDAKAIIIPFKIENILPKGEMKYYLTRTHWHDAMDPPVEKHFQLLVDTINQFTKVSSSISIQEEQEKLQREEERKELEQQERSNREQEERAIKLKEKQQKKQREKEDKHVQRKEGEELKKPEITPKTYTNSIGMKFILIPAGEFTMGSQESDWEKPVHKVTISKPFYLGTYPVTQNEWKSVMGNNPSTFKGDNLPVETVSWNDVGEFIKKLNEKEGADKYRIPTEAEWEYAARAGTKTKYFFGDDESKFGDYAWYNANSGDKTHDAGQKKPNPWGLYDIHGNVWEWVQDLDHKNYDGAPTDGSSWESGAGSNRVFRGGCWRDFARSCRSAIRGSDGPGYRSVYVGFRLLRIL